MAISVGLIVANGYYAQPILAELGREFALDAKDAGRIVMTTQMGTALGMLTVVPLGDTRELRRLITTLLMVATTALLGMATAQTSLALFIASFGVGMTTSIVHLIVP
jgi:predicted MFS family arabinose efflux permease